MLLLKNLFLVLTISLASLYLLIISIFGFVLLILLSGVLLSVEILEGLYQLTFYQQSVLFILIIRSILLLVPAIIYNNSNTNKLQILIDNFRKSRIYQWTHFNLVKYVSSAMDLTKRLYKYYSISILTNKSYMYSVILLHGYSSFSLTISEYIDIVNLSKEETKKLIF
jgi:hypothetical protein